MTQELIRQETHAVSTESQVITLPAAIEAALIGGDLKGLTTNERMSLYRSTCESLRLNPLTKPFQYIMLNSKLVLYATANCTDQLRKRDSISIEIVSRETIEDVYVVTARATTPDGRRDEATGAVSISGLKGENKANAMMKAETKAKRRITLSICSMGMSDETEIESIPGAVVMQEERAIEAPKPVYPAPLQNLLENLSAKGNRLAALTLCKDRLKAAMGATAGTQAFQNNLIASKIVDANGKTLPSVTDAAVISSVLAMWQIADDAATLAAEDRGVTDDDVPDFGGGA